MNELQIFTSPEFGEIRSVLINREPYFVGKDVADALGYSNTSDAPAAHVDEDDKAVIQKSENATLEIPNRGLTVINESGVYSLIFSSTLPLAKKFKHWVTSVVLPSLRKQGTYSLPELKALENKANLFDRLTGGYENKNFRESAKALDISQSQLIGWLKDSKMIYKTEGGDTLPSAEYKDSGFFKVMPYRSRSSAYEGYRTLITPTGLTAFANMLDAAGLNASNMKKHGGHKGGNQSWK